VRSALDVDDVLRADFCKDVMPVGHDVPQNAQERDFRFCEEVVSSLVRQRLGSGADKEPLQYTDECRQAAGVVFERHSQAPPDNMRSAVEAYETCAKSTAAPGRVKAGGLILYAKRAPRPKAVSNGEDVRPTPLSNENTMP